MKNSHKGIIAAAVAAIGFLSFNFVFLNQQVPEFSYKPVPKRFLAHLNADENSSYSIARSSEMADAYDLTKSLPDNYVKDGSVDYTSNLQNGIDGHQHIIFPNFPVLVGTDGLKFKSNTVVFFGKDSKILLAPNSLKGYAVFKIYDADNVKMFSPVIEGDRLNHQGTAGEAGIGIKVMGSSDVEIYRPRVSACWGDGIYIGNSVKNVSDNIVIDQACLDNNRRNGITITGGKNITVTSPLVSNTNGTAPMSGIDIEPNNSKVVIDNISISGYVSFNNSTSALQIGLSRLPGPEAKTLNIKVNGLTAAQSYCGIILGGFYARAENKKLDGNIDISNVNIVDVSRPIKTAMNYELGPAIHLKGVKFRKTNQSGSEEEISGEMNEFKARLSNKLNISMEQ